MFLAIDVGNTNVTLGLFEGESLRGTWRLATDIDRLADEYGSLILSLVQHNGLSTNDVKEAAMTCVVPELEPVFQTVCQRYFGVTPLLVGVGTRTGLKVLYDTPRDVGADRVVDAVAAGVELDGVVELAADDALRGVSRNDDRSRLDPLLGVFEDTARKSGHNLGRALPGEALLHLQVDVGEDLGHGGAGPPEAFHHLQVKTPLAFLPQKREIRRAESESARGLRSGVRRDRGLHD